MTEYKGYAGKIIRVDLTNSEVTIEALNLDEVVPLIGGFGYNNKLIYDLIPSGADALSPENPIVLGTGPLAGTMAPGSVRLVGTTKYPLTGAITSGAGSMSVASRLKWAGYDHVVITGASPDPCYLLIDDDDVRICDASHLWGKRVDETTDALYEKHPGCGVLAMGPGGENLVKFAIAFTDKGGTLGRGGFGAVMGSKKLKAVAVRGTHGSEVADTKRFMDTVNSLFARAKKYPQLQECIELGIMQNWDNYLKALPLGEWPAEKIDELYGLDIYKKVKKERVACTTCFIADKDVLEIPDGEFAGTETYTHSYLAVALSGVHFGLEDFHEAVKIADTVNANGVCQMTFEAMISYLKDLQTAGLLTEENSMGLDFKDDFEGLMNILDCITHRRGLGNILADGWTATLKHFGEDTRSFTKLIKDQDSTFDPRVSGLGTMEFEQIVNPRGAQSAASGSPSYIPGLPIEMFHRHAERMGADKAMAERIFEKEGDFNVGRLTRLAEDWYTVFNALGVCNRHVVNRFYSLKTFAELYSAATGIEKTDQDLREAADRIWSLQKALNVREGFDRDNDTYPDKWFEPFMDSKDKQKKMTDYFKSREITPDELNRYLNDYYDERGWDVRRGIPTRQKLADQGLEEIARDMADLLP